MIGLVLNNTFRFIALILLQVLVLNNVQLHGTINPQFYILFILLLPIEIPTWALLLLSFGLGLSIDLFTDTLGMHAAACTFAGFIRPSVIGLLTPRGGYENQPVPRVKELGIKWFATYVTLIIVGHHLMLFYVEVFRWSEFFITFWRALVSSFFTVILVILSQYLFARK